MTVVVKVACTAASQRLSLLYSRVAANEHKSAAIQGYCHAVGRAVATCLMT